MKGRQSRRTGDRLRERRTVAANSGARILPRSLSRMVLAASAMFEESEHGLGGRLAVARLASSLHFLFGCIERGLGMGRGTLKLEELEVKGAMVVCRRTGLRLQSPGSLKLRLKGKRSLSRGLTGSDGDTSTCNVITGMGATLIRTGPDIDRYSPIRSKYIHASDIK